MFRVYEKGAEADVTYLRLVEYDGAVVLRVVDANGDALGACNILTIKDGAIYFNWACEVDGIETGARGHRALVWNGDEKVDLGEAFDALREVDDLRAENEKLKAEIERLKKEGQLGRPPYEMPKCESCNWHHSAFDGDYQIAVAGSNLYVKDGVYLARKMLDRDVINGLVKTLAERLG